jgi:hypothetical protein
MWQNAGDSALAKLTGSVKIQVFQYKSTAESFWCCRSTPERCKDPAKKLAVSQRPDLRRDDEIHFRFADLW